MIVLPVQCQCATRTYYVYYRLSGGYQGFDHLLLYGRDLDIRAVAFPETFSVYRHFLTFQTWRYTTYEYDDISVFNLAGRSLEIYGCAYAYRKVQVSATRALHIFDLYGIFLTFLSV